MLGQPGCRGVQAPVTIKSQLFAHFLFSNPGDVMAYRLPPRETHVECESPSGGLCLQEGEPERNCSVVHVLGTFLTLFRCNFA